MLVNWGLRRSSGLGWMGWSMDAAVGTAPRGRPVFAVWALDRPAKKYIIRHN